MDMMLPRTNPQRHPQLCECSIRSSSSTNLSLLSSTNCAQGRFARRTQRILLARCSKRPPSPKLPRPLTHGTRRPLAKRQRLELVREGRERRRAGRSCTKTGRDEEDQATRGGRDAEGYGTARARQGQCQPRACRAAARYWSTSQHCCRAGQAREKQEQEQRTETQTASRQ
jgi:hypothetical protein